ncbi:EamA family transporter [Bradyrhizobium sp. HKCCYLS1011]|uniref:EamA family transporter n=1 Tax=Bradyrhizobium sp. HKCCYLS1011 TaxID=3420733 RepID=UPI003EBCCFC6
MSFAPVILVVLAAFVHATWNMLSKRAAAAGPTFVFAYNLIACIAYAPWVACVLTHEGVVVSPAVVGCILLSGTIHLCYSLCLQRGYQVADLSVVYPVARGMGPTFSTLGAFLLLGETPSYQGLLGLAAVVVGIGLILTQGDLIAFRQSRGQAGVRWGIATGLLISSYTIVDAYGVKALGIRPVMLDWFSNLLRFVLLAPVVLRNLERAGELMQGRRLLAIGVGLLSPLSYILVLAALEMGAPLSVVAPTREMSMMIGALFGVLLLREPVGAWRFMGCLLLVAGVVLLVT